MIHDHLTRADAHTTLHPLFPAAFAWLKEHGSETLPVGRIEIAGPGLVALPQHYVTHELDPQRFETHRRFIDIQYVCAGSEHIHVGNPGDMTGVTPYQTEQDIAFFAGTGSAIAVSAGEFVILWPHEAHAPGCHADEKADSVRKIVIKVAVNP